METLGANSGVHGQMKLKKLRRHHHTNLPVAAKAVGKRIVRPVRRRRWATTRMAPRIVELRLGKDVARAVVEVRAVARVVKAAMMTVLKFMLANLTSNRRRVAAVLIVAALAVAVAAMVAFVAVAAPILALEACRVVVVLALLLVAPAVAAPAVALMVEDMVVPVRSLAVSMMEEVMTLR